MQLLRSIHSSPALSSTRRRPCCRRVAVHVHKRDAQPAAPATTDDSTSVLLPGGVWVLGAAAHNRLPLYGTSFVVPRLEREAPPSSVQALVPVAPSQEHQGLQVMSREQAFNLVLGSATDSLSDVSGIWDVEDYTVLQPLQLTEVSNMSAPAVLSPPHDAQPISLGLVPGLVQSTNLPPASTHLDQCHTAEDAQAPVFVSNSSSPRRTSRVKFTCKKCGAVNIKPVNPYAWTDGSVFARCASCNVTHKLVDNLKLFHELAGPIFPPPPLRDDDIPDALKLRWDA